MGIPIMTATVYWYGNMTLYYWCLVSMDSDAAIDRKKANEAKLKIGESVKVEWGKKRQLHDARIAAIDDTGNNAIVIWLCDKTTSKVSLNRIQRAS